MLLSDFVTAAILWLPILKTVLGQSLTTPAKLCLANRALVAHHVTIAEVYHRITALLFRIGKPPFCFFIILWLGVILILQQQREIA